MVLMGKRKADANAKKGIISFAFASVFLIALISSAERVSLGKPDLSFEAFRAMQAKEIAIKSAFYQSSSAAAKAACIAALADEAEQSQPALSSQKIKEALFLNALAFESSLKSKGYDVLLWCGYSDEWSRANASSKMALEKKAAIPQDAAGIAFCLESFSPDLSEGKIAFHNLGFSFFDKSLQMGKAAVFPDSYEVEFDCV